MHNNDDVDWLDGTLLQWVDKVKHLGNIVNVSFTDNSDCESKRHVFNASVNKLIGTYGKLQCDVNNYVNCFHFMVFNYGILTQRVSFMLYSVEQGCTQCIKFTIPHSYFCVSVTETSH